MTLAALAALAGAAFGFGADRLAARWPAHERGSSPRRVDWRTLVVAVTGAAAGGAIIVAWSEPRDIVILLVYAAALTLLLATDLDQRLLPDVVTLPLIVFAAAMLVGGWSPLLAGKELALLSGAAAGIGAPLLLFASDRVLGGQLGAGDLKLVVSIALMSGVVLLFAGLLVASMGFAAILLALIAARRIGLKTAVPFGPVLIYAGLAAVVLA